MKNEFRITDDEDELESADFVVCVLASETVPFKDNVFGFCCKCDAKVQHRPHVPVAPRKVCLECAMAGMLESAAKGELKVVASNKTALEIVEHVGRRRK